MTNQETQQFIALRKISQMPVTLQRIADKMTIAHGLVGMTPAAVTKIADAKTAITTAETKIAEAIGLQAAAG